MSTEMARQTQTRRAVVLGNKMDKTVVVEVVRRFRHKKYQKFVRQRERYKAHDAENICQVGDVVQIDESRPLSKEKRWRVSKILQRVSEL